MRNLKEILYEKELELARVRQQVEALKFILPLLIEETEFYEVARDIRGNEQAQQNRWPLQLG